MHSQYLLKILVAEDNPVNQRLLLLMLKKLGYYADVVATGVEALSALECRAYDLVLMDIQMPEMDGIEATRIIRRSCPYGPKVIIITAFVSEVYRELCFNAGADDFLTKPVDMAELNDAIQRNTTHVIADYCLRPVNEINGDSYPIADRTAFDKLQDIRHIVINRCSQDTTHSERYISQ
jgi:CheY-like chemotaxis protein